MVSPQRRRYARRVSPNPTYEDAVSHRIVARDGTRIAWHDHGGHRPRAGHATPVLLTNGLSTTDNFWRHLVTRLAPEHPLAHWQYRGHRPSDSAQSGDYSIATHATDLAAVTEAFLDATHAEPRAAVHVAFSMGVTVLLELYRQRPELVSAMVLIAGGASHPYASSSFFHVPGARSLVGTALAAARPVVPRMQPLARRIMSSPWLFSAAQRVRALGREAPRDDLEHFFRAVGDMDLEAYWKTLESLLHARADDVLPRIDVPVLVIAPESDVMALRADLEALRQGIPGAEWLELPGTSHAVLLEAGDTIAARIDAFLASRVTKSSTLRS